MADEELDIEEDVEDPNLDTEVENEDADDEHTFVVKDEEDKPDEDEEEKSSEEAVKFEDLQKQFTEQSETLKTLNEQLLERDKEINRIAYQLRTTKKETKTEEPAEFTDAQLQGLLEEHKEDPAAMLQIMKLVTQQAVKKGSQETLDTVEISNTKKEMDSFLNKTYPDLAEESSDFRRDVDNTKSYLGMNDHPYGDFFAVGTMVLNNLEDIIKHAREEGKNEALKGTAEGKRKQSINANSLSAVTGKKTTSTVASSRYHETAKKLGLSPAATKKYVSNMAKKDAAKGAK